MNAKQRQPKQSEHRGGQAPPRFFCRPDFFVLYAANARPAAGKQNDQLKRCRDMLAVVIRALLVRGVAGLDETELADRERDHA
ncbi:MAG TPA: hypothetical protein VGZ89_01605 [Xanthobacteraceae bacterium]|nr:hypothetical protein [Xanthobacteraceae bacterium]